MKEEYLQRRMKLISLKAEVIYLLARRDIGTGTEV